ncbi:MAG: PAS domain S-box protein [Deltaproteobacteria bacterium]|nr:PAS domain S-box protein [Deltaproteobacteria bacterium]
MLIGLFASDGSHARLEFILGLAALALVVSYSLFIYGRVLAPIATIDGAVRELSAGNHRARIDVNLLRRDEFGALAQAINKFTNTATEETHHCRNLLMAMPDPVVETDEKGFIKHMNDAACVATGYTPTELVSTPFTSLIQQGAGYHFEDAMKRILQGEPVKRLELPLVLKDGRTDLFEFTCAPIWRQGSVAAVRCVGRDTQERCRMLEELLAAKSQAEETSEKLKRTVKDLEEFALLAVRREFKMQEIRDRFVKLKQANGADKDRADHGRTSANGNGAV